MLITKRFYKTVKIAKRTKLPSDLVIFLIFSFDIPLDFHELIGVMPLKCLTYFLAGLNTK